MELGGGGGAWRGWFTGGFKVYANKRESGALHKKTRKKKTKYP